MFYLIKNTGTNFISLENQNETSRFCGCGKGKSLLDLSNFSFSNLNLKNKNKENIIGPKETSSVVTNSIITNKDHATINQTFNTSIGNIKI